MLRRQTPGQCDGEHGGWALAILGRKFKEGDTALTHVHNPSTQVMYRRARINHTQSLSHTQTHACMHNYRLSGMERPLEVIQSSDIQPPASSLLPPKYYPGKAREYGLDTTTLIQAL